MVPAFLASLSYDTLQPGVTEVRQWTNKQNHQIFKNQRLTTHTIVIIKMLILAIDSHIRGGWLFVWAGRLLAAGLAQDGSGSCGTGGALHALTGIGCVTSRGLRRRARHLVNITSLMWSSQYVILLVGLITQLILSYFIEMHIHYAYYIFVDWGFWSHAVTVTVGGEYKTSSLFSPLTGDKERVC